MFENETVLLKGNSGFGKTTLLRLIEKSLSRTDCLVEKDCSAVLVYQDLRLVAEKSVLDNVLSGAFRELPSYSLRFNSAQIEKAKYLIKKVQLHEHQSKLVSELSGGQRQRVAIIRALMSSPAILLADECFSQLDNSTALDVFALIKSLQSEFKFTVLISQHSSVIDDSCFDRKIDISENAVSSEPVKKKKVSFMTFWFAVAGLVAISIFNLEFSGFNSSNAVFNSLDVMSRFADISQSTLLQFDWLGVFSSFLATLRMALIGSFFGFVLCLPLAILAARNIAPPVVNKIVRFFLMAIRTVPSLVWALIFVAAFGLGSMAGVCALTLYSMGYLGKLIYESLEDLEQKAFASLRLLGASRSQAFVLSLLPKARPMLVGHFVFMLEYNIRAASVLGLVGAGGIGQDLMYNLEWRRFSHAGLILLIMIGIIYFADKASDFLRRHLLQDRGI